ncbi:Serine carboxypeptidase-like, partial [Thalictrum thalictroides]
DNPVGTGYSFVEEEKAVVKTDEEAATDLTTLLKNLFNNNENLQKSPLYIVAESYGGKYAVTLGLSASKAIEAGELKLKLGGVALGDSWISPEDFVFSWGPLLKDISRLDVNGLVKRNRISTIFCWIQQNDPVSLTSVELSKEIAIKRLAVHIASGMELQPPVKTKASKTPSLAVF